MSLPPRRAPSDDGFTLIELLVAVTIMSIAFVILLSAILVFTHSTTMYRGSADLDGAMRTYTQALENAPYDAVCPTDYSAVPVPAGFTASLQIRYLDPTGGSMAYTTTTCPASDKGAQRLTATLTRTAGGRQDQLVLVKRQP